MASRRRPRPALPGPRLLSAGLRSSRVLLRVLYLGVVFVGVVVAPPPVMLVLAPALGVAAAGFFALITWSVEAGAPSRRSLLTTAAVAAGFVPFVAGIHQLGGVGTWLGLAVLALVAVVGGHAVATVDPPAPLTAAAVTDNPLPPRADDASLRELLRVVPLETLFCEWQTTEDALDGRAGAQRYLAAVQVRALLLDEMGRRDPGGVDRWLTDGPQRSPEHYVRGDRDLAT